MLSPLLYSLFTHDCVARHHSNPVSKFADDTTVVGLLTGGCPILIDGPVMEQVECFKFLGVHITNKLSWSNHSKTVV